MKKSTKDRIEDNVSSFGSECSPYFELEPIEKRVAKAKDLVMNKSWQIKAACRYCTISETTFHRLR